MKVVGLISLYLSMLIVGAALGISSAHAYPGIGCGYLTSPVPWSVCNETPPWQTFQDWNNEGRPGTDGPHGYTPCTYTRGCYP